MTDARESALSFIGWCLSPSPQVRPRLRQAAAGIKDWELVLGLSGKKHVAPAVWTVLGRAGLRYAMPEKVRERFEQLYLASASGNLLRLEQALRVARFLKSRGIKLLFMKGAALVIAGDYPDPGARMFSDVDLLGRKEDREEIARAFRQIPGFRKDSSQVMEDWQVDAWTDEYGNLYEVHWGLKPYNQAERGLAERRLFENAAEVEYRGFRALVPSREDRFLQAALHFTVHHYFDSAFFYPGACDLAWILNAGEQELDWDRLVQSASRERVLEHLALAVELAKEMTRDPGLEEASRQVLSRGGELSRAAPRFAKSLARMARKSWDFETFYERRLLAEKSLGEWARYLFFGLARRFIPRPGKKAAPPPKAKPDLDGVVLETRHEKRWLDRDFLRFLYELYRFDRKTGFKIKVSDKTWAEPDD